MKFITAQNLAYFLGKLKELFASKTELNTAKADLETTIGTTKTEAIDEAKGYTDTEVGEAKTELTTAIGTAKTEAVDSAKTYTDTTAGTVKTEAISEAKTYTDTTAGTAKTEAIADAKSYTDTEVGTAKTELQSAIDTAKSDLQTEINTKVSAAYKVKGSSAFASLPALAEAEEGNVYNVSDEFTTTDSFVERAGQKYPAGTNIVCIEAEEGVFKWDILAGFIDTDSFVKNTDVETVTEADIDAMFAA